MSLEKKKILKKEDKYIQKEKRNMKYYVKQMASIALVGLLFLSAVNSAAAQKVQAADRTSMVFSGSGEQKKGSTKVKKVTLNKKNLTLTVGNSKKLSATLTYVKKQKIIWKSSNKKVATVKNGKVTGISVGTAKITANVSGKKASCKVKVTLSKKAKEAVQAYKSYLEKDSIKWSNSSYQGGYYKKENLEFALADVNLDGTPELFLHCDGTSCAEGHKAVFYYLNGKVTEADRGEWIEAYYPSKGIVEVVYGQKYGSKITGYVKIPKKGKAYEAARTNKGYNHGSGSYNWNGNYYWNDKQVMESEFNSLLNKLVGKKKIKIEYRNLDGSDSYSWKWHENTLQNRKNMESLIKW